MKTPEGCRQCPGASGHIPRKHQLCLHEAAGSKLPDCCEEELPEISEGGAGGEDIIVMEFLTGFPCEREVHLQSLTGCIPLVEEGTPAKPLQSKLAQAVVKGVTAALCETMHPL